MLKQNLPISERIFSGTNLQFLVLSRNEIESFTTQVPYLIISVTDIEKDEAKIANSPFLVNILRLSFDDVGKPSLFEINNSSMTEEDALKIILFVKRNLSKVKMIVCQCEQGVSRSAAIAQALSNILQPSDNFPSQNYWANLWVYDLITKKAKEEIEKSKNS